MITIRQERSTDIPARERLLDAAFGPARLAKTSERLREGRFAADELSFVAVENGRLIGTARLWSIAAGLGRPGMAGLHKLGLLLLLAIVLIIWWPKTGLEQALVSQQDPNTLTAVVIALGVAMAYLALRCGAEEIMLPGQHGLRDWAQATPVRPGRILRGYLALIDKVCPCVLLVHSQGGNFGFLAAEQRPDKIKGIVAVESATAGKKENAAKLKDVPVLMVFGDYVDQHPRWATFKKIDAEYGDAIKAAGGTVDWINLPDINIKGNSHMLMQDKNSDEIAEVIQKWLVGKGLAD